MFISIQATFDDPVTLINMDHVAKVSIGKNDCTGTYQVFARLKVGATGEVVTLHDGDKYDGAQGFDDCTRFIDKLREHLRAGQFETANLDVADLR